MSPPSRSRRRRCRARDRRITDVTAAARPLPGSTPWSVRTEDGVDLAGLAVSAAPPAPPAPGVRSITFVVAHGFTNSVARPSFGRLIGWLRRFGEVRALDFRGHGRSGGASAVGGDPELADVDAAVRAA